LDIDDLLHDEDTQYLAVVLAVQKIQDKRSLLNMRHGSMPGRICIPRNRSLGHHSLMQDYFIEVPTYPRISSIEGFECGDHCLSKS
jgi:hypothetical protein